MNMPADYPVAVMDGTCALCAFGAKMVHRLDRSGDIRIAPIQGATGAALMAEHGLETTQDLQGWTIAKLAQMTVANGQRPAAWEEAAQGSNGGIGHGAILFSWTGQGPGLDAARAGYDVVMTPAQHLYFDMAHTDDVRDWGANWAAYVDLADTINWDPVPDPALSDRILGVQGAFWSEFTTQDAQIWPMLMPRMLGLSAMAWQKDAPSEAEFMPRTTLYDVTASGRLVIRTP